MGKFTNIEWANRTWNPWRGCTKIHARCKNCYMFTEQARYGNDPSVVMRTKTWGDPPRWQKAAAYGSQQLVFTCSWSDWFHRDADGWRDEAWAVVKACPNLTFQILTKRPERIEAHLPSDWGDGYPNVWLGSSLDPADKHGLDLFTVPAKVRFLSLEPLLAPVDLKFERMEIEGGRYTAPDANDVRPPARADLIHWVIVGGESGPRARPCNVEWLRDVVRQCKTAGVPCFVKQFGSKPFEQTGLTGFGAAVCDFWTFKQNKGGDPSEWPEDLRVREFP